MSRALATQGGNGKIGKVRQLLDASKGQIALALPKHMTADRMARIVMTSVQKTPALLDCEPRSLIGAVIQASQLGLEPDGVLGQAYLVPFKGQVALIPGYKGLIELARRSGRVQSIQGRVVWDTDEFEVEYGDSPRLRHKPGAKRGTEMIGAYAVAHLDGGGSHFEYMPAWEIRDVKKGSPGARKKGSPWDTHEPQMWVKTAIRRLCKFLPMSVELQRAVALDEMHDAGIAQGMEFEAPEAVVDVTGTSTLDAMVAEATAEDQPETVEAPAETAGAAAEAASEGK